MTPKFLAQVRVTGEEHARLAAAVALLDTSISAVMRERLIDKLLPQLEKEAADAAQRRAASAKSPAGRITEAAVDEAAEALSAAFNRSEPIVLRIDELYSAKAKAVLGVLLYLWQVEPDDATAKKLTALGEKYLPVIMRSPVPTSPPVSSEATIKTAARRRPRG